jgi:hypothetical protein
MGLFDSNPQVSINVGASSGTQGGVKINGELWEGTPQVNGSPQASGYGAVITAQVGRKQVILGVGGLYPNQTEA